ncbi:U3 small nuclear riboprotein factor 55K [Dermatophagoides farinae]|uniref:Pre-rRNA processing protein n=1 Tax=Dermatophagoides farinae TaxID=6954 RepID=A0A922IAH5_DERFA|nr:pre-rRNA processing protein [Dermatophagoides farinae]
MPFFIRNKAKSLKNKTRVKNGHTTTSEKKFKSSNKKVQPADLDEEILSDDLEDDEDDIVSENDSLDDNDGSGGRRKKRKNDERIELSEDENETAQEKKIRLAKKYLSHLEQSEMFDSRKDDDEDDGDLDDRSNLISSHLKESVLEKLGKLHRTVAHRYGPIDDLSKLIVMKNGHKKAITAVVVSNDGRFVFSASKDCNIVKWNLNNGKRLHTIYGNHRANPETYNKGHTASIQSLALSTDFKFLASGCKNKVIHIWNPETMIHIHTFRGHRGSITGLAFRRSFHQLFSCSEDRMIKVWNLDEMGYVESLFGHHDSITAIDSFVRDRCITSGGRDGTIRLWKIPEESNLIFLTGGMATIDCVRFIDESHFISASDDGSISLWAIFKKKPLQTISQTHEPNHWITSLASLRNTDLFASGSHDGRIIFWKIKPEFKGFERLFDYKVDGFINSMEFTTSGQYLIVAISQEHRLGRWFERFKNVHNVLHIIPMNVIESSSSS